MSKRELLNEIKHLIKTGNLPSGDRVPLFWVHRDGHYIAGKWRLAEKQFNDLNSKYPCFPSDVTAIVYEPPR
jgi:hypothetical protein